MKMGRAESAAVSAQLRDRIESVDRARTPTPRPGHISSHAQTRTHTHTHTHTHSRRCCPTCTSHPCHAPDL